MGSWGLGTFENDDALDWLEELKDSPALAPLAFAFESVLESGEGGNIEIPEASIALAAAEVLAALLGNPGGELPEEIRGWLVGKEDAIAPDLVERAREAITRVSDYSELLEAIEESDDAADWKHEIVDLLVRLS